MTSDVRRVLNELASQAVGVTVYNHGQRSFLCLTRFAEDPDTGPPRISDAMMTSITNELQQERSRCCKCHSHLDLVLLPKFEEYGFLCRHCALEFSKPMSWRELYKEYLSSPQWEKMRQETLERVGYRCQVCNGEEFLNVHHRTYARVRAEHDGDLTVLCRDCHAKFHDKLP